MSEGSAGTPPPQSPAPSPAPVAKSTGPSEGGGSPKGAAQTGSAQRRGATQKTGSDSEKDRLDDETRGVNQALRQGDRFFSTKYSQHGPSAYLHQPMVTDLQVGDRIQIYAGQEISRRSGSVRKDVLSWVRARYLPADDHDDMREVLKQRRVILLRGQPGTGRATTALHLLDRVAESRVFRFRCGKTVKSLTGAEFPEKNAGYVTRLPRQVSGALTEDSLDELRDRLEKASSFCVLVAEGDARFLDVFGGYAFDHRPPDPAALLAKHIEHEVRPDDPPDLEDRLKALRAERWVADALGPCPRPLESMRMATLLVQHARGELTREDVEGEAAQAVHRQVGNWFAALQGMAPGAELDEALRLCAFRVALAVLNDSPYNLVAEAAEILGSKLVNATGKDDKRRVSLFADDQGSRLPALRAGIFDGYATFGREKVPMPLLRFHDPRYPTAILDHVWSNHHRMRDSLNEWLTKLGEDDRPMMWVRAAQATGYLCRKDFVYVYTKMIRPRAVEGERGWLLGSRRLSPAIALDQAAQDDDLRPAIIERLQDWRRSAYRPLRWTAAATYGFSLGRRRIDETLEELRVLGTPSEIREPLEEGDDWDVIWISGYSVAKLLAFGKVTEVLACLRRWIGSDRSSLRRLALRSLQHLTDLYGFELDHLEMATQDDRPVLRPGAEQWPLLLTLHSQDPSLTKPIAELLRESLRAREGDVLARHFLARWIRCAEQDEVLLDTLAGFLAELVGRRGDAERLLHLIGRLTNDWADPLQPGVAARLTTAIKGRTEMKVVV
ncbi:hypothetical protein AB0J40_17315 [Amycolatopsis sp. NPDC049691]|uniref:hypothetical protein n=1 Tax=Amycolatopsis sp. NPDC049691 TaxID=3155155 RepID=UPI003411F80F